MCEMTRECAGGGTGAEALVVACSLSELRGRFVLCLFARSVADDCVLAVSGKQDQVKRFRPSSPRPPWFADSDRHSKRSRVRRLMQSGIQ
jgi:hypothetical protein